MAQQDPPIAALRSLLAKKVRQTADTAASSEGVVSVADIQGLEALSKLCVLAEAAAPRPTHRLLAVGVVVASLVAVSGMFFIRTGSTAVELEASVSSARFRLSERARSASMQVRSVSLMGGAISDPAQVLGPGAIGADIKAVPALGSITVQSIDLPTEATVNLERDSPTALQFDIAGPGATLQLSLHGKLLVSGKPVELKIPRSLTFTVGESRADVSFAFLPDSEVELLRLWPIDQISLFEIHQDRARKVSAIKSGSIFFEELNGQERKFREAEHIQIDGAKGNLRTVRFAKGEIGLRFDGQVAGLTTGAEKPRPLMPTWLDLARANQPLILLWGTTGYVIGVLFAILKWLDFKV